MKNLKAKLKNQGGFTLIEMLIVVAIIAILIAVSIPIVNNALDRTKHATDAANERAAKAEIMVQYLSPGNASIGTATNGTIDSTKAYAYDATNGILLEAAPTVKYNKCSKHGTENSKFILVTITNNGTVYMKWTDTYAAAALTDNEDLCSSVNSLPHS